MCVLGERECVHVLAIFYRPQALIEPPSSTNKYQNIVSHCVKGRSSLKTRLNQPWVLTFFGYMLMNPSPDVVVSLF